MSAYELHALNLPKLSGFGLTAFTAAVENPLTRSLLLPSLLENGGIPRLRSMVLDEPPTYYALESLNSRPPLRPVPIRRTFPTARRAIMRPLTGRAA